MYSPPHSSVLFKLVGQEIEGICIYRYQMSFLCGNQRFGFTISSPFRFGKLIGIGSEEWIEFPVAKTDVPRVVGSQIVNAETGSDHSLKIEFSNGDALVASWTEMYEVYELLIDGERVIV